jgi:multidrug efflux pump subunit AcrA (membrane-fusion protein)
VRAPRAGVIEALLVRAGDVVSPGKALGKLVPLAPPMEVVCFLAEKDRAFVRAGAAALLELDQLPYAEYGTLKAKVLRLSSDLASPLEVQEALGEGQTLHAPCVRVDLAIMDPSAAVEANVPLRSGMLMDVRFTLRRQRLITLVLEPLRKWLR